MRKVLDLRTILSVLIMITSSIFCADIGAAQLNEFREIEFFNERSIEATVEVIVQFQERLSAKEKRKISAEPGFTFHNGATLHKIQNTTSQECTISLFPKRQIRMVPQEKIFISIPEKYCLLDLKAIGAFYTWRNVGGKAEVIVNEDKLYLSPQEQALNLEYANLEEQFSFCLKPEFDYPFDNVSHTNAVARSIPESIHLKPLAYTHALPAFEDAVLISMVKDEADVILENLCFHFFMGFRKFIIIDNGSTDATYEKISDFKNRTARLAEVIRIKDSRVLYAQSSRTNAIKKLAEEMFPSVQWIFPNDADEFIVFDTSIEDSLSKIARSINCIQAPRITYMPTDDYFSLSAESFYEKLSRAHKRNPYDYPDDSLWNGKTFIRAHLGMLMVKGNHFAAEKSKTTPNYISSLDVGMHIREFPLRSPEHALRKIVNMGKAHIALRASYPDLTSLHYADDRYTRYLRIGDSVGEQEFRGFLAKGKVSNRVNTSFDESMLLGEYVSFVSTLRDFDFLPEINISFIFYEKLYAEKDAAKRLVGVCQKLGVRARISGEHSNQHSQQDLDICMTGSPYEDSFKVAPSTYSYMYSHVNTAAMCRHFPSSDKKYKFFMQVGENCRLPNFSLYGRKKGFYFTKGVTEFKEPNIEKSSIFFCGGSWDSRYMSALSILDRESFFNWYGGKELSSKQSYKGFVDSIIDAIKKHGIAITLHSKFHLENGEPSARIFEAAAAGAVIISDQHPFVVRNFADNVLYINQDDTEEKIARDIIQHYQWVKNNPQQAIQKARRAHQIFIDKFTAEDQILRIVQMHQETLILDGMQPLSPRSNFMYLYDKSNIKGLNQLLQTSYFQNFTVKNLTAHRINHLMNLKFIKRIAAEGEIINTHDNIFFIDSAEQRISQLFFSGRVGSNNEVVPYANHEARHESIMEKGSIRKYNLSGYNMYLSGFYPDALISSYEVRWLPNSFEVILR